ncbi:PPR repeat [Musa troglodytarum]|uniref:PPR repeat n=1 Tax=Musa troglodytarum TaxID=320322 RepID=A0A9E7JFD1_9LILI|nr:PPR repeat [Musa troglodytarum]
MGRGEATFAGDGGGTKSLRRWAWAAAGALTAVALAIFAGSRNALEMPASVTNSCDCPPVCFPVGGIEELHRLGGGLLLRLRDSEFAERAGAASDTTGAREDSLLSLFQGTFISWSDPLEFYGLESDFVGKPTGYWNCVTHLTLYWFPMQLGISLTFFLSIHCLKNTVVYFDPSEEWCDEKKVMYKLISGLHSSISVHIASEYLLDSSANLVSLCTLPFTINALRSSMETPRSGQKFVFYISLCSVGGDKAKLWQRQNGPDLLQQIQNQFRNISALMNCVGCEKCRLWGKLQVNGLATALKVLFSVDGKNNLNKTLIGILAAAATK